ncbi:MAG: pseudoazurin [Rhodovibrio sp.]|nr:pseudoazurin [Rhodovibrio sp.]
MRNTLLAAGLLAVLTAGPAAAETIEVKMLNKNDDGEVMVYEPSSVSIEPGDTVRFVATAKGHNAQSVKGMIPEGADSFRGGINQEVEVTFEKEGTYVYKCLPHLYSGMVGVVKVGDAAKNLDDVRKKVSDLPKQARDRLKPLLAAEGS